MYFREWDGAARRIRTLTSTDFETWDYSQSERLIYPGLPDSPSDQTLLIAGKQNLYTNACMLYERAPHITIGFPTYKSDYYIDENGEVVQSERLQRWNEPEFMSSRDGVTFQRGTEAVIPRDTAERQELYGNFMTRGLVQLPGNDEEYTIYAQEGDFINGVGHMRMWTYRLDGFMSVRASELGGEIITKAIVFDGNKLVVNFVTSDEDGSIRVEIQDLEGNPMDGFALADCEPISGDAIEQQIVWTGGSDLSAISGMPVHLRFALENADLFSFRFVPEPTTLSLLLLGGLALLRRKSSA